MQLTSGECFVLEFVIDNLKQNPNMVTGVLEELESRLTNEQERSRWLADEEDGYKGDGPDRWSQHNTSGYLAQSSPNKNSTPAPNAPHHGNHNNANHTPHVKMVAHEESLPLYPTMGMPSEV